MGCAVGLSGTEMDVPTSALGTQEEMYRGRPWGHLLSVVSDAALSHDCCGKDIFPLQMCSLFW